MKEKIHFTTLVAGLVFLVLVGAFIAEMSHKQKIDIAQAIIAAIIFIGAIFCLLATTVDVGLGEPIIAIPEGKYYFKFISFAKGMKISFLFREVNGDWRYAILPDKIFRFTNDTYGFNNSICLEVEEIGPTTIYTLFPEDCFRKKEE